MTKTIFKIQGMRCESCKLLIEEVAQEIKGVKSSTVNVEKGTAFIEHEKADLNLLKKEIEKLGKYKVQIQ